MYKYITTQIDSFLADLVNTSQSPSHIGLCRINITVLAPLTLLY
jgi:hypothetical protein